MVVEWLTFEGIGLVGSCILIGLVAGFYLGTYARRRSICIVINIQGTIAAGKSTQMKLLRKRYGHDRTIAFVDEPLHLWDQHRLLDAFYYTQNALKTNACLDEDMTLFPSTFQLVALITRARLFVEALRSPQIKLLFAERSMHSDLHVFANANLVGDTNKKAYQLVYDSLKMLLPPSHHHHFFLHIDTNQAMNRIAQRGRRGEDLISVKYMHELAEGHDAMAKTYAPQTYIFEADQDAQLLHQQIVEKVEFLRRIPHYTAA